MKEKKKLSLAMQIFIALVLAIIAGLLMQSHADFAESYIKPFGTIFLNLVKFIVVPIVLFSIMCGIISMSDIKKVGAIGLKTVIFYLCTTAFAVTIGLTGGNLFKGLFPVVATTDLTYEAAEATSFMDTIVNIFPSNFVSPMVEANMLQIIVMAILLGFAIILVGEKNIRVVNAFNDLNEIFMKCMEMILKLSPIGVFCLLCPVIAANGPTIIGSLAMVLLAAYICYIVHMLVVYSLIVKTMGGLSPAKFLKGMLPAIMFAFSSASSVGTLPINLECTEKLGAKREVASFVLPLGATINMDGTAIYQGVCAIFIASCYGISLTLPQMLTIVLTATLASIGTAGVPGAGMIMLAMVLTSVGLPVDGIALVAGVDRIVMTTPPGKDGKVNPSTLVAANEAGADEIYKVGGAQAIGALAYGTESIPKVDKIVGPGNIFVALAKKAVYGYVSIDSIAGPSEILVLADETANPRYIAADLLSQAEHDEMASAILITTNEEFADKVDAEVKGFVEKLSRKAIIEKSLENFGYILIAEDMDEAIEAANEIASEHMEIVTKNPFEDMMKVRNAGAIFIGEHSSEPLGDYFAGPNHVLPTNGTAKFFSALSVDDFIKKSSIVYYSREALRKIHKDIIQFATSEQLTAHANSIAVRFEEEDKENE